MNPTLMERLAKWVPDRKVWLGGLSAILAWLAMHAATQYGYDPQPVINAIWAVAFPGDAVPSAQPLLAGIIATAIAYLTPASARDVIKKIDDDIARAAGYLPAPSTASGAPTVLRSPPTVTAPSQPTSKD